MLDPEYPECLRKLRYPPWILFYKGDIRLLQKPMCAVIGSRMMSDYGKQMTDLVTDELKQRFVIVSGLAKGVDSEAHRRALNGGHTVGVVGNGLDVIYPKQSRDLYRRMAETDLILSEYPRFTGVRKHHFPWRNRILAALSEVIVVTQAVCRSGTMITVNEGITLGREIWCAAYPFGSPEGEGCSHLVEEGANILYDKQQLKEIVPKK